MAQNIEKVIQRGERLDDLVDKTDELNAAVSGDILETLTMSLRYRLKSCPMCNFLALRDFRSYQQVSWTV